MKPKLLLLFQLILLSGIFLFSSCDDIIEPSISKNQVTLQAPANLYVSSSYTINFWWNAVNHALSYHLQVVTPNFTSPGSLALDTVVTGYKFAYLLAPGNYQWRVMAQNGSSQTAYSTPNNFTIAATSITQQAVQLIGPASSYLTNQTSLNFQWSVMPGATKYNFEIDTNNFSNANAVLYSSTIPGQQISYTFPKAQQYQWRVQALNDTAQAQWSAINTLTFNNIAPAQVSLVVPTDGQITSKPLSLQWNSVKNAIRYKLYMLKSDSTSLYNSNFPLSLNSTSYSFNLGNSGDKIYWKVSAVDVEGNEGIVSALRSFSLQ